jgi:hypothetical protein
MIKLSCHCGLYHFDFSNGSEKSLAELLLDDEIDTNGLPVSTPKIYYSLKGQKIDNETYLINHEGTPGEVLELNKLTYDIISKKVVQTKLLNYLDISSNNIVLGLMSCNSVVRKFTGIFNLKQNITEIISYETY